VNIPDYQTPPEHIVDAFAQVARPIIRRASSGVDSPIISTRIAVDVFRHFGLQARPLVVRKAIFNAAAVCLASSESAIGAGEEANPCVVRIGYGSDPAPQGCFSGHLVAVVERQFLVDVLADQANNPNFGINLPGVLLHAVTPEFLVGWAPIFGKHSSGSVVRYRALPGDRSYAAAPEWRSGPSARGEGLICDAVWAIARAMTDLIPALEVA
jgi:hypothetical protein